MLVASHMVFPYQAVLDGNQSTEDQLLDSNLKLNKGILLFSLGSLFWILKLHFCRDIEALHSVIVLLFQMICNWFSRGSLGIISTSIHTSIHRIGPILVPGQPHSQQTVSWRDRINRYINHFHDELFLLPVYEIPVVSELSEEFSRVNFSILLITTDSKLLIQLLIDSSRFESGTWGRRQVD